MSRYRLEHTVEHECRYRGYHTVSWYNEKCILKYIDDNLRRKSAKLCDVLLRDYGNIEQVYSLTLYT